MFIHILFEVIQSIYFVYFKTYIETFLLIIIVFVKKNAAASDSTNPMRQFYRARGMLILAGSGVNKENQLSKCGGTEF